MLTRHILKEFTRYNPDTGEFIWIKNPKYHARKGFNVGGICEYRKNIKYRRTTFEGKLVNVHRVIFLYMTGSMPEQVDHIDGNGLNNKWANLRGVTNSDNCRNRSLHSNNKSGISGVRLEVNKWLVDISYNGTRYYLGTFKDFFEACCIRKSAEIKYDYHPNHGRISV